MRFLLKFYLLLKEDFVLFCSFTITGAGWVNDVNNFSFSSLSGEDDFEIGSFATFPFISSSSSSFLSFFRSTFYRRKKIISPRWFWTLYTPHALPRKNARKVFLSTNFSSLLTWIPFEYIVRTRYRRNLSFLIAWYKDHWFKDFFFFFPLCIVQTFPRPQS